MNQLEIKLRDGLLKNLPWNKRLEAIFYLDSE